MVVTDCACKGLTVLPIHDALLCKESDADRATTIMLQHWTEALGFEPKMKRKRWELPRHRENENEVMSLAGIMQ